MKEASEITALCADYGTLGIELCRTLSKTYKRVLLYIPNEDEFRNIKECCKGDGIDGVERVDEIFDPEHFDDLDLAIFPDIGWGQTQKFLRAQGKAVWGSMGGDEFELYRTRFLDLMKRLDLPIIPSVKIKGLTNLELHLKDKKNKWVKVNKFRGNTETFHWIDVDHSSLILDGLKVEFGGLKEQPIFVVQDDLETDVEIGFDGWTVDGQYPESVFSGYEKKNELYLGSLLEYDKLPDAIKDVNEAMAPVFKELGYRNFFATELRIKDDVAYFIDPTMRMPGQTGEQLLETCTNLADVIWAGANGEMIVPEYAAKFSAEATMYYTAGEDDWRVLTIPEKVRDSIKLYHFCELDGVFHFPPAKNTELGVVLGMGDTIVEAIDNLKENFDAMKDEPVKIRADGFKDLVESIESAEEEGIEFTSQPLPEPEEVV